MSWINRILVPVDLSSCSIAALRYGAFLCEYSGAELIVIHVDTPNREASPNAWDAAESPISLGRQRCKQVIINELLGSVSANAARSAKVIMGRGEAVETVLRTARQEHADLIVMGRHGDGRADASRLGNVTRAVAEQATCGVIPVYEPMQRGAAFALSVMGANDTLPTGNTHVVRPVVRYDRNAKAAKSFGHPWHRDPHTPGSRMPH